MSTEDQVLAAYHRAIARHRDRTGVSYPFVRASCVDLERQEVGTTGCFPEVVATFTWDALDRVRIRLV